jgi:hypothetical protein
MLSLKVIFAIIFVVTGGAVFSAHFNKNKFLVILGAIVSITSAYYLFLEMKQDIIKELKEEKNIIKIDGLKYENRPFTKEYTWNDAKSHCSEMKLGNYEWRLPKIDELKKILTNNTNSNKHGEFYIRKEFIDNLNSFKVTGNSDFKNMFMEFWITGEDTNDSAWTVNFTGGDGRWLPKTRTQYVLCVSE